MAKPTNSLKSATIAVTGATGFLGRYIAEALIKRGAKVIGVVRNPSRVPQLVEQGVEMRRADLQQPAELVRGFQGADIVISNAALFALDNVSSEAHRRANIEGTENVLQATAAAGIRRVLQISSVAVYQGRLHRLTDEDHPQHQRLPRFGSQQQIYSASKALSEQTAWRLASALGLQLTTLRPCGIYGAHDPNITPKLRRLFGGRIALIPRFAHIPLVYAGDVAEAVVAALETPASIGQAYNITGEDLPLDQFLKSWYRLRGHGPRLALSLPFPVRRTFDNGRAKRELGWTNRPYLEGLRDMQAREA